MIRSRCGQVLKVVLHTWLSLSKPLANTYNNVKFSINIDNSVIFVDYWQGGDAVLHKHMQCCDYWCVLADCVNVSISSNLLIRILQLPKCSLHVASGRVSTISLLEIGKRLKTDKNWNLCGYPSLASLVFRAVHFPCSSQTLKICESPKYGITYPKGQEA